MLKLRVLVTLVLLLSCAGAAQSQLPPPNYRPPNSVVAPNATTVEPRPDGRYPAPGPGHVIQRVSRDGGIILLKDGSIWQIAPSDTTTAALWLPLTEVSVLERNGPYRYKLLNLSSLATVNARYLGPNSAR